MTLYTIYITVLVSKASTISSPQEMASPENLVGYYQYGSGKKMGVFYRDEQGCTKVHSLLVKEDTIDDEYERSQERCLGNTREERVYECRDV